MPGPPAGAVMLVNLLHILTHAQLLSSAASEPPDERS